MDKKYVDGDWVYKFKNKYRFLNVCQHFYIQKLNLFMSDYNDIILMQPFCCGFVAGGCLHCIPCCILCCDNKLRHQFYFRVSEEDNLIYKGYGNFYTEDTYQCLKNSKNMYNLEFSKDLKHIHIYHKNDTVITATMTRF